MFWLLSWVFILLKSASVSIESIAKETRKEQNMGRTRKNIVITDADSPDTSRSRPVLTPESRENYLISLAYDLVERRLKEGTATSQETTHFLKLGSTKERLEKEILEKQKELITAKTENLQSQRHMDEMYMQALNAIRSYNGQEDPEEEDYD